MSWLDLTTTIFDLTRAVTGLAVNWVIQSTLLIAAGLALGYWLRGRGSAMQSAVYRTTLITVLVVPLATCALSFIGVSGWSLRMPMAYAIEDSSAEQPGAKQPLAATQQEFSITAAPSTFNTSAVARENSASAIVPSDLNLASLPPAHSLSGSNPTPIISDPLTVSTDAGAQSANSGFAVHRFGIAAMGSGALWLVISSLLLARLLSSMRQLNRLRRGARSADIATVASCREVAALMQVAPPEVLHSPYLPSPCLTGVRHPAVMLPEDEMGMPVREVLVHELAHLRRRDCAWNLLRRVATAVLFFQPLLWKLSRRLEAAAEEVCDDYVVEFGGNRQEYAHRLVNIAELTLPPLAATGVGIVALRSMLAARVARIMDTSRSLSTRVGGAVLVLLLIAGLSGTLLVGLVGIDPPRAEAEVSEKVDAEDSIAESKDGANSPSAETVQNVKGRVLDPDGKPLEGAAVIASWVYVGGDWPRPQNEPSQEFEHTIVAQTKSNKSGEFDLSFPKTSPREGRLSGGWHIAAFAEGYGPAWKRDAHLQKDSSPVLQLTRDGSILGRIVDLEGKPVAGVRVKVHELKPAKSEQAISEWIADSKKKSPPSDFGEYLSYNAGGSNGRLPSAFPSNWDDGGLAHGSTALPSEVIADQDGRFQLKNLGSNRLAILELDGPTLAKTYLNVVTRDMDALSARPLNFIGLRNDIYYGRQFEYVAEPTQPIEGTVRDAESGEPIANVRIQLGQFAGNLFSQSDFLATHTDERGHFKLLGAPQGGGHRIDVVPSPELPYFPTGKTLDSEPGSFEPIHCDFELRRGKWITGKITEKESGEPVDNVTVEYLPLRSNKFAPSYPNYRPEITGSAPDDRYRTSKDGSFRVLGIPGPGILAAIAPNEQRGEFAALSVDDVPAHLIGESPNLNTYHPWTVIGYHALREIELLPDSTNETPYDLELTRGLTRRLKFADSNGESVKGVRVMGRIHPASWLEEPSEQEFVDIIGLRPKDERVVALLHPDRHIGRALLLSSGAELTIEMQPCAIARGRVVDGDGEPAENTEVNVSIDRNDNWHRGLIGSTTDAKGRFEVRMPAGLPCRVWHYSSGKGPNFSAECEPAPGAIFELGDLTSGSKLSTDETKAKLVAADSATTASAQAASSAANSATGDKTKPAVTIRGRVVDTDGQPVAGATVRLPSDVDENGEVATSEADGRFEIEFDKSKFTKPEWHQEPWRRARLIASAKDFGPTWVSGDELAENDDPTLVLRPDDVPLRGQVLTLEGAPVPKAHLEIWDIYDPHTGNLDGLLKTARDDPQRIQGYMNREMEYLSSTMLELQMAHGSLSRKEGGNAVITTDDEGRFEVRGIGAERLVRMQVEGTNIQSTQLQVLTREKIDAEWTRNDSSEDVRMMLDSGAPIPMMQAATFTHLAGPSAPIRGVVRDKETGQPLEGISVNGWLRNTNNHASATTDKDGRFELTGLALDGTFQQLYAGPKQVDLEKLPYLGAEKSKLAYSPSDPLTNVETDFELTRGILVRGRVLDAATQKPVKARVEHFVQGDNPKLKDVKDEIWPYTHATTNDNGEFTIAVLPGPGALAVWTRMSSDLPDRYRPVDPKDFGLPISENGWISTANRGLVGPTEYKAARFVNFEPDDDPPFITFTVNPMTDVAHVRCVDPQGQPIKGVTVVGHLPWSGDEKIIPHGGLEKGRGDNFHIEIAELGAKSRKPVIFRHHDRNLSAILWPSSFADLKQAEDDVHLLTLAPSATISGRLVDADGTPVENADVELHILDPTDPSKSLVEIEDASTDKRGRFELTNLPASGPYFLVCGSISVGSVEKRDLRLTAGEKLDLGELTTTLPEQPAANKQAAREDKVKAADKAIRGQVLDVTGNPIAGAHLAVIGTSNRAQRGGDLDSRDETLAETTTDSDGQYRIELDGVSTKSHMRVALIARAEGAALQWKRLNPDAGEAEMDFQLPPDEPIRGRLVDIEGQPATGIKMSISALMVTSRNEMPPDGVGYRDSANSPAAWIPTATSDDDGRFSIHNLGPAHGVSVNIPRSEQFAPQMLALNTGMPEQRGERDGTYRAQVTKNLKPGEEAVLALAPAQIFEGVVRYEDSGEPAPHSRLTIWASQQEFGSMLAVPGEADDNGHFRISPYPGIRFGIAAYPPNGAPYLARKLQPIKWEDASRSKAVDVTLPRGVLVHGKVVEAESGAPVANATVQYVPEAANNPNDSDDILTGWQAIQLTNRDGEFNIVILPGPGNLLIHGPKGEFVLQKSSERKLSNGTQGGQRKYAHAFERIDPKPGEDPIELTVNLQRGQTIHGRIVANDDTPADDALVITKLHITPESPFWRGFPLPALGGNFELAGLQPKQEYRVHFLDAKRRLGATATLTTESADPVITLQPCGAATARYVDPDGQPLADFNPTIEFIVTPGGARYDFDAVKSGELSADSDFVSNIDHTNYLPGPKTDANGQVTFPALIPGATYRVTTIDDGNGKVLKEFTAKSLETTDLGEIEIDLDE